MRAANFLHVKKPKQAQQRKQVDECPLLLKHKWVKDLIQKQLRQNKKNYKSNQQYLAIYLNTYDQRITKWREQTTPPPPGKRQGIYSAIRSRCVNEGTNTKITVVLDDALAIQVKIIHLAIREANPLLWCKAVHHCMLEKYQELRYWRKSKTFRYKAAENLIARYYFDPKLR
jgi:hypothetical protein